VTDPSLLFTSRPIGPGLTLIEGVAREYCYLVEGERQALLIDTLSGIGDLRAYCEGLTRLPLSVANTHGHFDHIGGDFQFNEVNIHPADVGLLLRNCDISTRFRFALSQVKSDRPLAWSMEDVIPPREIAYRPLAEGDAIDLGGRVLEVLHSPGHTRGSVCFLDKENGVLFAGDTCNTNTLVHLEESTSIQEFLLTLRRLKDMEDYFDVFLICHETSPLDKSCLDDVIECCVSILDGTDDGEEAVSLGHICRYARTRGPRRQRLDGRLGNVAYHPGRIRIASAPNDGLPDIRK
jgi:glyoxylase-like metal-dependent hydrolase (beta-lactamase superfamily II)